MANFKPIKAKNNTIMGENGTLLLNIWLSGFYMSWKDLIIFGHVT
jgi:hypothetical protein